jgi:hypothetical protein
MADILPTSSADVMESGSLNLSEPSGAHRPVMGLLYIYLYLYLTIYSCPVVMKHEFSKSAPLSNFMKILPVEAELFHTEGQTRMTKIRFAFHNSAKSP